MLYRPSVWKQYNINNCQNAQQRSRDRLPDCMNKLAKLLSMLFVFLCVWSLFPLFF